jgi:hypothetical protein
MSYAGLRSVVLPKVKPWLLPAVSLEVIRGCFHWAQQSIDAIVERVRLVPSRETSGLSTLDTQFSLPGCDALDT